MKFVTSTVKEHYLVQHQTRTACSVFLCALPWINEIVNIGRQMFLVQRTKCCCIECCTYHKNLVLFFPLILQLLCGLCLNQVCLSFCIFLGLLPFSYLCCSSCGLWNVCCSCFNLSISFGHFSFNFISRSLFVILFSLTLKIFNVILFFCLLLLCILWNVFIYGVFNDTVRNSDCMALIHGMIKESFRFPSCRMCWHELYLVP